MIDESYQLDSTTSFKSHWKDVVTQFGSLQYHENSDSYVVDAGNSIGLKATHQNSKYIRRYCSSYIQRTELVDRKDWMIQFISTINFAFRTVPATANNLVGLGVMVEYDTNKLSMIEVNLYHDVEGDLYLRCRLAYLHSTLYYVLCNFRTDIQLSNKLTPDVVSNVSTYHAEVDLKMRMMTANGYLVMYPTLELYDLEGSYGDYAVPMSTDYYSSNTNVALKWKDQYIYPFIAAYQSTAFQDTHIYIEKVSLQ